MNDINDLIGKHEPVAEIIFLQHYNDEGKPMLRGDGYPDRKVRQRTVVFEHEGFYHCRKEAKSSGWIKNSLFVWVTDGLIDVREDQVFDTLSEAVAFATTMDVVWPEWLNDDGYDEELDSNYDEAEYEAPSWP